MQTNQEIRDRKEPVPWKILVTGAGGLVGSALTPFLTTAGHTVKRLVRSVAELDANAIPWAVCTASGPLPELEGLDAVVHLAGENIMTGRW